MQDTMNEPHTELNPREVRITLQEAFGALVHNCYQVESLINGLDLDQDEGEQNSMLCYAAKRGNAMAMELVDEVVRAAGFDFSANIDREKFIELVWAYGSGRKAITITKEVTQS
jgi:hypothetical protein